MYGLKEDIDLSFLNGRELTQVAVGSFDVLFNFDEDASISVIGQFKYFDDERECDWTPTPEGLPIAGLILACAVDPYRNSKPSRPGRLF